MKILILLLFFSSKLLSQSVFASYCYSPNNDKSSIQIGINTALFEICYTTRSNEFVKNNGLEIYLPIKINRLVIAPYFYKPWFYSQVYKTGEKFDTDEVDLGIQIRYKISNNTSFFGLISAYNNENYKYAVLGIRGDLHLK